jgi:serine/threonine-protein kinase
LILDRRYKLQERVGSGGTATVYRGHDLLLGEEVAVKIMHDMLADDQTVVERFWREACAAELLRHRNIVRAFDHGRSDGMHYIVMEHVRGPSVKTLIANAAPLEPAHAIDMTLQILAATRFIHNHGVIHRDLKPSNVLMSAGALAKITDFGIASYGAGDITPAGSFLGTVHYLSPELVTGAAATEASDVYSIGIILYELLTGRLPFEGELVATVARRHQIERPVPPARINDAVSPALNAIVLRALEKSPRARTPDCKTFAAALSREMHRPATASALQLSYQVAT